MTNSEENQGQDPEKTVEDALRKAASEEDERAAVDAEDSSADAANAAQGEAAAGDDALENALAEVQQYKDLALRAEAEMQNVRRRAEQDVEKAHKYSLEKFISNLLPVVDSLEKAIESAESADGAASEVNQAIIEGVGLCHKMLLDVMAKEGCEIVDPEGEPFDPNLHQAMSTVESDEVEPNTVTMVVQKGYTLNGRLVRPAMVMVSRAPG